MAASGLGSRKQMVSIGWGISLLLRMNELRKKPFGHVGPPFIRAVGSSPGVGRLIDQSGDAAEGSKVEACSADNETFRAKRARNISP